MYSLYEVHRVTFSPFKPSLSNFYLIFWFDIAKKVIRLGKIMLKIIDLMIFSPTNSLQPNPKSVVYPFIS